MTQRLRVDRQGYKGIGGWMRPTTSEDHVAVGMKVQLQGIDRGGAGVVLAIAGDTVAVKWPGSMGWGGIGSPRSYNPPHVAVYQIKSDAGAMLECEPLLEWSLARKPKGVEA